MNLSQMQQSVQHIYPSAVPPSAYTAGVDSSGNAVITNWNLLSEVQPTVGQLEAAWSSLTLAQAKDAQRVVITSAYENARWGKPLSIAAASGSTLTFPVDGDTQMNVMGYVAAFAVPGSVAPPAGGFPLRDVNGVVQSLVLSDVQNLAGAIALQSIPAFVTYDSLLVQINAATTVTDVRSVVWPIS